MRQADAYVQRAWPNRSLLMAFGWGAVIGAGIGAISSAFGASRQNEAAKDAASAQMAFQRESAQNQYQWAMADMRKAGLNPILAYKQGGSGTLGGSSYSPVNVGAAASQGAASGVSSAIAARRINADLDKVRADTKLSRQQEWTEQYKQSLLRMNKTQVEQKIKLMNQEIMMNLPDVTSAKAANKLLQSGFGEKLKWLNLIRRSLGGK